MYLYDIAEEIEIQIKWRKQLRCCTRCVRPGEIAFFLFVHCFFSVFFMTLMQQDRTSGLQMTCIRLSSRDFACPTRWHGLLSRRLMPECPSSFPCVTHCYVSVYFRKKCCLFLLCVKVAQKVTGDKQRASTSPLVTSRGKRGGDRGRGAEERVEDHVPILPRADRRAAPVARLSRRCGC